MTKQYIKIAIGVVTATALFAFLMSLYVAGGKGAVSNTALQYETKKGEANEAEANRAIKSKTIQATIITGSDADTKRRMQQYWESTGSKGDSKPGQAQGLQGVPVSSDLPLRQPQGTKGKAVSDMRDEELLWGAAAELLPTHYQRLRQLKLQQSSVRVPMQHELVTEFDNPYSLTEDPCKNPTVTRTPAGIITSFDCTNEGDK